MASEQKLLCLNILGFKKPGISAEDYRNYMIKEHAPLVAAMFEKYGFLHWSMVSHSCHHPLYIPFARSQCGNTEHPPLNLIIT